MSETKIEAPIEVPLYDSAVHRLEDNPLVRLEAYCECGGLLRWGPDPVSHVAPQLHGFEAEHHGPGHGPVTAKKALAEREARRKAGFRMAGRQAEYTPKEHDLGTGETTEWTPTPPEAPEPLTEDEQSAEQDAAEQITEEN